MAKKCARTFSIVVEKGKKSIRDVGHLLPDALPRSVRSVRACMRALAVVSSPEAVRAPAARRQCHGHCSPGPPTR
eukprot:COSAG06_NODE_63629_length_261_cov_30.006173_1_plen_74_part_01